MRGWDIRTNWLDRLPGIHTHHQPYLPLYPLGFAGTDLSAYDLVLSNKSGFCHGVRTGAGTALTSATACRPPATCGTLTPISPARGWARPRLWP